MAGNFAGWLLIESTFRPNKEEIWLHRSLLDTSRDRWSVFRRRLFPARVPRFLSNPHANHQGDLRTRSRDALHFCNLSRLG